MSRYFTAAMILGLIAACGVTVTPKPVTVNPITVNHEFHLAEIQAYFEELCKTLDSSDRCYNVDYKACSDCLTGEFLRRFN